MFVSSVVVLRVPFPRAGTPLTPMTCLMSVTHSHSDHETLTLMIPMKRLLPVLLLGTMLTVPVQARQAAVPDNVILFIADGTGPATYTMARDFNRALDPCVESLSMDPFLTGTVRTFAADSRITDSASSATAYATGIKTYNGAIAMDPERQPVATLVEAAEQAGMNTALISTARITHATPAAFSAHVHQRAAEDSIAVQQLSQGIEILLGGGRQFFFGPSDGGVRKDSTDLVSGSGYALVQTTTEMNAQRTLPVLGLFNASHMSYEMDRAGTQEPSLAEMTGWALDRLSEEGKPFFIMIEAGRIDHAGHGNDAAAHLHDMIAYEKAFATALAWAEKDGNTLLVATSDHETGGLSLGGEWEGGGSGYRYDPTGLSRTTMSVERFGSEYMTWLAEPTTLVSTMAAVLEASFDVTLSETERLTVDRFASTRNWMGLKAWTERLLKDRIAQRAAVHWSTGGHTAVDVPLFAFGGGSSLFTGSMDNTEVGQALARVLGFNLNRMTQENRSR